MFSTIDNCGMMARASERATTPVLGADHARHALEIMVKAQESAREDVVKELSATLRLDGPFRSIAG